MANDSVRNSGFQTRECVVLIADDDLTVRLIASDYLMRAGFTVIEAEDGPQALAVFEQNKPDIVLLDVMMPGMDGFETCASIRSLKGRSRGQDLSNASGRPGTHFPDDPAFSPWHPPHENRLKSISHSSEKNSVQK